MSCLRLISGLVNNPNFHKIYLTNYNDSKYEKKNSTYNLLWLLRILKISESETSQKKKNYNENSKMTLLKLISGLVPSLVFHGLFLQKYSEPELEILTTCTMTFLLSLHKISLSETSQKKSYSENSKMTHLKLISG
jgi:hypothetical protein